MNQKSTFFENLGAATLSSTLLFAASCFLIYCHQFYGTEIYVKLDKMKAPYALFGLFLVLPFGIIVGLIINSVSKIRYGTISNFVIWTIYSFGYILTILGLNNVEVNLDPLFLIVSCYFSFLFLIYYWINKTLYPIAQH